MTVLLPLGGPKYLHPAWRSQDAKHYTASLFPHSVAEEFAKRTQKSSAGLWEEIKRANFTEVRERAREKERQESSCA